jgi:hypothetical protein
MRLDDFILIGADNSEVGRRPDGRYRARYRDPVRSSTPVTLHATVAHGPGRGTWSGCTPTRYVYPAIGGLPMRSIRPTTVQAMITDLASRLSPLTLKLAYGYVVAVFRAAVRDRIVASSPCDGCASVADRRRRQVEVPPLTVLEVLAEHLPPRFQMIRTRPAGLSARSSCRYRAAAGHALARAAVPGASQDGRVGPCDPVGADDLGCRGCSPRGVPSPPGGDRRPDRRPVTRAAQSVFTTVDGGVVRRHRWSAICPSRG